MVAAVLMKELAMELTPEGGGVGKVWSEMRLKSRVESDCMSVPMFSGASVNARRTTVETDRN